ncbi:MAG: sterol desaturase family protein [Verrucomicrobia bacterium]|nr:sterol desaturase family protein [Verrucomicrobiota bacterium]
MSKLHNARLKVRAELEVPAALRRFGSGWISGVLGVVLGIAGLLLVISLRAPGLLAMPESQPLRDNPWYRIGLHVILLGAFATSALSLVLRKERTLGTCGVAVTLLAAMIGGSHATAAVAGRPPMFLGLDFFVLNVLFTGFLFIPLERFFSHKDEQHIFREEWREDLFYYLVSSLLVQMLTFLTFVPAKTILAWVPMPDVRAWVGALPFVVQFVAIMFLTDLVQYWVHRAFHRLPWLWKFHAVHHSARSLDWMAGARMHFLEILALRSMTVIPMYVLGFSLTAMNAYILLVYIYSTFVHANLNWRFPVVEKFLVTPRFHHWHHGIEREAVDVNFAIHFPLLDRLFGTYHLPKDKWPDGYGVEGHPVPLGYWAQFKYPFQRTPKTPPTSD